MAGVPIGSGWRPALAVLILLGLILIPFALFGEALEASSAAMLRPSPAVALAGFVLLAGDAVLPVPSSVVATSMGYLLGPWVGGAVNAAGLTAGCVLGLALGRSATGLAERILGAGTYAQFAAWIARNGPLAIMVCRPVPVLGEASLIAAGAGKARFGPSLLAAFVADLLIGGIYGFAGAASGASANPAFWATISAFALPAIASVVTYLWIRFARGSRDRRPLKTQQELGS